MHSTSCINVTVLNYFFASDGSATTCTMTGNRKTSRHKKAWLSGAVGLLLLGMTVSVRAQLMEDISKLQDGVLTEAYGVSANGAVIVGSAQMTTFDTHAFRYDLFGGVTDLQTLGGTRSEAYGASADGAVIVGYSSNGLSQARAFRYDTAHGMSDLGTLGGTTSIAYGVSADGAVIVGVSKTGSGQSHAFRSVVGNMTDLDTFGSSYSVARGASADGAVIIGYREKGLGQSRAFRYDAVNGMVDLNTFGGNTSVAYGVSADGAVIVGFSTKLSGQIRAFRYDTMIGMTDLGTLGGNFSIAYAVSGNGRVIVGSSTIADDTGAQGDIAVIHAFKVVDGVMTDLGTLGGNNSYANSVSANGAVIVGNSQTTNGIFHAFIYRNIIVDVPNTYAALGTNAGQLAGLLNARQAVLGFALHDECNSYSVRNVCVSAGGRSTRVEGGFADTAAQLQLGYRFSPQLRIGASLDQGISTSTPGNYTVNHSQPLVALYAAYAPTGTPTGLQLKVSVAQGSDDVGITRSLLANTEAGRGASSLTAKGVQLEAGWGWTLGRWQAMSFAGVKDMRLSRAAYTETSGADFPVSYQAVQQTATTAYAGLQTSSELATNLMVSLRGGVEQDLHRHQDGYAGTMEFLGPFAIAAPTVQRTRAFAAVSGTYRITPTQQLSIGAHYSQQPQKETSGMTVIVRYSAAL